jgi:hypothetical protein
MFAQTSRKQVDSCTISAVFVISGLDVNLVQIQVTIFRSDEQEIVGGSFISL